MFGSARSEARGRRKRGADNAMAAVPLRSGSVTSWVIAKHMLEAVLSTGDNEDA